MHGSSGGTNSIPKVFGNIFISFIGAGVLGLPYAFKEAGILEGIFIMSLVGYLSVCAMLLLIDCKDFMEAKNKKTVKSHSNNLSNGNDDQSTTLLLNGDVHSDPAQESPDKSDHEIGYGDVGYFAYGTTGSFLVDIAIIVSQTGFCCAYLIFITENTSHYFLSMRSPSDENLTADEEASNEDNNDYVQRYVLFIMLFPLCLLCFLRHLHKLAIFSLFADFANVFAYSIVFWFDFEQTHTVSIHPREVNLAGFPFFAGMAVYCYEGAGMILSLESSMAADIRSKFRRIFKVAMLLITTLYILFGVCGYLSFGEDTNQIITLNLPLGVFPLLVKMCLCFSLFFTYPVMMFPVVQIIEKRTNKLFSSYMMGNLLRACMVFVTGLTVLIIPSFSTLMSLVGAVCCSPLAFILPAVFHMKIFKSEMTKCMRLLDYLLIFVGVGATLIGTWDSLKRLGLLPGGEMEEVVRSVSPSITAASRVMN